jgi:hypothetical protein|tara:strand:- start:98 stop:694 length:597 start_codon:yes stop_codon:yes gene_type:complete
MKSVYDIVVSPVGSRYTNKKKLDNSELILNTDTFRHEFVNREAIVKSLPIIGKTNIRVGDIVIVHHNLFRRWHDVRGEEKNSYGYFNEQNYFVSLDQVFLIKRKEQWICPDGYCFVKPIVNKSIFSVKKEEPLKGVLKHADKKLKEAGLKEGDLVGFSPDDEYEFVIDGQRLYRIMSQFITIKYEYQGNEEEYNPSWT